MALKQKTKLALRMRRYARLAALARLNGRMPSAMRWDDEIKKVYLHAKLLHLGEGFLVRAEEDGRNLAQRAYDRGRGARTSSPSGRDRSRRGRARRR